MKHMQNVSVIIPTFKRSSLALALAKKLRKKYPRIEIIIVEQETEQYPAKKILDRHKIKYFNLPKANSSVARNKGINEATRDFIVFFDDDVEVRSNCLENHVRAYRNPSIIGVAGRVINDHERVPKDTKVSTGKTNWIGTYFSFKFWSTKKQFVDFPYGCNMSFRRDVLLKIKGFDTQFDKIFEEIDAGVRASKHGKIVFEPEALVYHHKAKKGGTRTDYRHKELMIYGSYGYYIGKNIIFPFSLMTLLLRMRTALSEASYALPLLLQRYVRGLFTRRRVLTLLVICASCLIAYIRTYKVAEFFSFNYDEEYQATLAWSLVKNFHILWIGVSASGLKYYLGPGFTYLNWILFKISSGDPVILAYFAAGWGIMTTISIGYISKRLFGAPAGIIAAVLYGGSAFFILFDRRFWNPLPVPFITLWLTYSLIKARENTRWLYISTALIAISYHVHLSLWVFWPLIFYTIFKYRSKIRLVQYGAMIALFFIITSPLFVFDLVHGFDNILAPLKYIQGTAVSGTKPSFLSVSTINQHFHVLWHAAGRILFLRAHNNIQEEHNLGIHGNLTPANPLLAMFTFITVLYFIFKNFKNTKISIIAWAIIFYFFIFIFYPGITGEYFLLAPLTLVFIAMSWFISRFSIFYITLFTGAVLLAGSLAVLTSTQEQYGLITRKHLIENVMTVVDEQPFLLETYGPDERSYTPYGGWRYLFKTYGATPIGGHADEHFGWIYPDELSSVQPVYRVQIYEGLAKPDSKNTIGIFAAGAYTAYIVKE